MRICLKSAIVLTMLLACCPAEGQQTRHLHGVYQPPSQQRLQQNTGRFRNESGHRVARRPQEMAPRSVLSNSEFATIPSNFPTANFQALDSYAPAIPLASSNQATSAEAAQLASKLYQGHLTSSNYGQFSGYEGNHSCLTGDIFGISREGICDEWYGHCACLELTNSRSNCECDNPRRSHWGLSDSIHGSGSCTTCDGNESVAYDSGFSSNYNGYETAPRSARRQPVSDYFHPKRR